MKTPKQEFQQEHALLLHIRGYGVTEIADTLRLPVQAVARLLKEQGDAQRARNESLAALNTDIAVARCDIVVRDMVAAAEELKVTASNGDPGAASSMAKVYDTMLKAEDRRAKLLGTDKAKNITVEVSDRQTASAAVMSKLLDD